ncbi:MAG: hypothetical protein L6Q37_03050 [Bdellovibrionaceae bacterium]|nr:hypothetical protein [Pseudobdellovibrionaceae bacterium]NUM57588.1 hypothetical protein [Pseudobdellovibrionaceae bacterium]
MLLKNFSIAPSLILILLSVQGLQASSGACFRFYDSNIAHYIKFLGKARVVSLYPTFTVKNDKDTGLLKEMNQKPVKILSAAVDSFSVKVKLVLYPASGFDSNTVFTVFKNARTVIGIDKHGFISKTTKSLVPKVTLSTRSKDQGWVKYTEIDSEEFVGADLIGNILSLSPSVRVLSVTSVHTENGTSHGIIEFDYGESTPKYQYIHVQAHSVTEEVRPILDKSIDAVYLKAAMDFFDDSVNPNNRVIIDQIEKNKALIVDADGVMSFVLWPYLDRESEVYKKQLINNYPQIINTHIKKIGYDETYLLKF